MFTKIIFILTLFLMATTPVLVLAQSSCNSLTGVCNPAGSEQNWTVENLTANIIKKVMGVLAVIFIVLILWAGATRLFARGNASQIKKSYDTILWAVLGLVIIFSSYIILNFVFSKLSF
ncbi:MAG TPA: hypothetical protein PLH37_03555 [bacterium]|nr:hypothetical protein [bacterium]